MRNIWFLSPLILSKQENLALLSLYTFEESVFIFQFLNDKIYNYILFDLIVNFIIQNLEKKHFPQKVYKLSQAKFSCFDRMRGEKNQIFLTILDNRFLQSLFLSFGYRLEVAWQFPKSKFLNSLFKEGQKIWNCIENYFNSNMFILLKANISVCKYKKKEWRYILQSKVDRIVLIWILRRSAGQASGQQT